MVIENLPILIEERAVTMLDNGLAVLMGQQVHGCLAF
jgi:hypothetical protein